MHKALRIELGVPRLSGNLWEARRHAVQFEGLELGDDLRAHDWTSLAVIDWRKPSTP